ncbi:hypothetical protein F4813DRAFT_280594 [Daldinia decipiens]|uniref:uncharacterized protein n=1 Tax=Daldinia decipiens TaxID=326647 RepID=UPI0020C38874|nr:uncharacterized protein F4813DRAFT_280594 [Daldinia decipiens]KAI1653073.1 hypothetical protein F4813DRAFT_280594 [Daldinia decipiens]
MLWAKKSRNEVLTRRLGAPSWTWMGWEGATSYLGTSYFTDEIDWLTNRTWVDWYIVDGSDNLICVWDSTRDTIIDNRSSEGNLNLQDKPQPIWRYGHCSEENLFGRKTVLWPIQEKPPTLNSSRVPRGFPYLAFVTTHSRFNARVVYLQQNITTTYIDICDKDGLVCGTLRDYYLSDMTSPDDGMKSVEIITISYADEGLTHFFTAGKNIKEIYGEFKIEPLPIIAFNVLVIAPHTQKPGIYERVGSGFLLKDSLFRGLEPPIWKQIVLG